MIRKITIACFVLLVFGLPSFSAGRSLKVEKYFDKRIGKYLDVVAGEVLVKFKPTVSAQSVDALGRAFRTKVARALPYDIKQISVLTPEAGLTVEKLIERYQADPSVEYAEPNFIRRALATVPNDPSYALQWGLPQIEADLGWDATRGTAEVIIAVIDSGMNLAHEDLTNKKTADGYDFVNVDNDPEDDFGHGTHVCGICAAETNNGKGVAGVSWYSKILALKVLDSIGHGTSVDIVSAINYAVTHGAKVINMSLGGEGYSGPEDTAVQNAHGSGLVIVAAAGNNGDSRTIYPAAFANVIGVAAVDKDDFHASYSNYNAYVDVCAPGGANDGIASHNIYSTYPTNAYAYMAGTSMATPFVSGLAALILAKNPSWTNTQVENRILFTADDLGGAGRDDYYGYGRINAYRALFLCPPADFSAEAGNAKVNLSWSAATDPDLSYYNLYRSVSGSSFTPLITLESSATSYIDTAVTNEITYSYKISISSASEEGISSEAVTATPIFPRPTGTVAINSGAIFTKSGTVTLTLTATAPESSMGSGAQMEFSNDNVSWSSPEDYDTTKSWALSAGNGAKAVYVKFKNTDGIWMSSPVSDGIYLLSRTNTSGVSMISIPFYPPTGEGSAATLGVSGTLQLARWDPTVADSIKYKTYPDAFVSALEPGKGYFLKLDADALVNCNSAYAVDEAGSFEISVKVGWNQIGHPFLSNRNWSEVRVRDTATFSEVTMTDAIGSGWVKNGLWKYAGGSYDLASNLEPCLGYWLKASRNITLIVPRPGSALALSVPDDKDWQIRVCAAAGDGSRDLCNYFGVAKKAEDAADNSFDVEEPPSFGDTVGLRFTGGAEDLAVDIRQPVENSKTWDFEVRNDGRPNEISLKFENVDRLPEGLDCKLTDVAGKKEINLRTSDSYAFNARPGGNYPFKVTVSKAGASGPLNITGAINYPNPFNPLNVSTGIRFNLSRDAAIVIKIFDVSGNPVRSIEKSNCGAGINTIAWDGRDDSGDVLANGVYFYLITARDPSGNEAKYKGKMAIWK